MDDNESIAQHRAIVQLSLEHIGPIILCTKIDSGLEGAATDYI